MVHVLHSTRPYPSTFRYTDEWIGDETLTDLSALQVIRLGFYHFFQSCSISIPVICFTDVAASSRKGFMLDDFA